MKTMKSAILLMGLGAALSAAAAALIGARDTSTATMRSTADLDGFTIG